MAKHFAPDYIGTCVEVGAYDGVTFSNTMYFEERNWNCLCVEPNPKQFEKCTANRKLAVNCCAGAENRDDTFFTVYTLYNGTESAISSLQPDDRLISRLGRLITEVQRIPVQTRTLTTILDDAHFPTKIDFISIDTENTELDVLHGFAFDRYDVTYFIIENNYDERTCIDFMATKGYVPFARLGVNDVFRKKQ